MVNELPTVFDIVTGKKQKEKANNVTPPNKGPGKPKVRGGQTFSGPAYGESLLGFLRLPELLQKSSNRDIHSCCYSSCSEAPEWALRTQGPRRDCSRCWCVPWTCILQTEAKAPKPPKQDDKDEDDEEEDGAWRYPVRHLRGPLWGQRVLDRVRSLRQVVSPQQTGYFLAVTSVAGW